MDSKIIQALELAGILTVTHDAESVTITLRVENGARAVPSLPPTIRKTKVGASQRYILRAIESDGPMVEDVIAKFVSDRPQPFRGRRDTRQQNAKRAMLLLHDRGLIEVAGETVKIIDSNA